MNSGNSNSKVASGPTGWKLRVRKPISFPILGKFPLKLKLSEATKPLQFYLKDEEIKDDINEQDASNEVKDAEYYRRKKAMKRSRYSKKSKLVFQESNLSVDRVNNINFEGMLCDVSLDPEATNSKSNFRYALLEVVTTDLPNMSKQTEVNLVPLLDVFDFRRPALGQDMTLEEVDYNFDRKALLEKMKLNRYKNIGHLLKEEDDSEERASTLYGTKASSVPKRGGKLTNKLLLSSTLGYDMDENRDNDVFQGDFKAKFADDDEENIVVEQHMLNMMENNGLDRDEDLDDIQVIGNEDEIGENDEDFMDIEEPDDDYPTKEALAVVITGAMNKSTSIAGINERELEKTALIAREAVIKNKKRNFTKLEADNVIEEKEVSSAIGLATSITSLVSITEVSNTTYDLSEAGMKQFVIDSGGSVSTDAIKKVGYSKEIMM